MLTAAALLGTALAGATEIEVTGKLGSPTPPPHYRRQQLPAPQPKFGGVIRDNAVNSAVVGATSCRPGDAPNILFIMTDDAAGVCTFGGVIPTPTMDRTPIAACANRMFSTSLCSPTRAASSPDATTTGRFRRDSRTGHRLPRL